MSEKSEYNLNTLNKPKETGSYLLLSLFLLLLSFFALLNALATVEESKARDVLTSLATTFGTVVEPRQSTELYISSLGAVRSPKELLKEVERLWSTQVIDSRIEVLSPGNYLQLVFPANELFVGGEPVVRSDRKDLIRSVAGGLSARSTEFTSHLQFVMSSGDISVDQLHQKETLAMARTAAFANSLIGFGASEESISIGIRRGDRRKIRMRFVIRETVHSKVDFQRLVQ